VCRYQKGKTNLDFTEAGDSEWQWHQLGHMQVCISLQTDNHASTPPLKFFTGQMPFLSPNQQRQSTEGTAASATAVSVKNSIYIIYKTHHLWFLLAKLVAWKCQNMEQASTLEVSLKLNQVKIMCMCVATFTGHIDNQ